MPNTNTIRQNPQQSATGGSSLDAQTPGSVHVVDRRPKPSPPEPASASEPENSGPSTTLLIFTAAILSGITCSAATLLTLLLVGVL